MSRGKRTKQLIQELDKLEPAVASKILVELVEQCPEVTPILSVLVREAVAASDPQQLTRAVEEAISRTFSDSHPRRVRHRHGRGEHFEPSDEISELLIEALAPYVERLVNLLNRKNDAAALTMCLSIILALYNARNGDAVLARVANLPQDDLEEEFAGAAEWASRLWRTGGDLERAGASKFDPERMIPEEFVEECVPEWEWLTAD